MKRKKLALKTTNIPDYYSFFVCYSLFYIFKVNCIYKCGENVISHLEILASNIQS